MDDDHELLGLDTESAPQLEHAPAPSNADVADGGASSGGSSDDGSDDGSASGGDDAGELEAILESETVGQDDGAAMSAVAAASADGTAAGGTPDLTLSKSEAKKRLSKAEYKAWKKARKRAKKKAKKEKKGKASKKRKGGDDDAASFHSSDDEDEALVAHASRNRAVRPAPMGRGAAKARLNVKPQKKTDIKAEVRAQAAALVRRMADARAADVAAARKGEPPLARLALRGELVAMARRAHSQEPMVESGVLKELSSWLCTRHALAPCDLRTAALTFLDALVFEGLSGGNRERRKRAPLAGEIHDTDMWGGVTPEQLRETFLGWAIDRVRRHPQETPANRALASRVCQRLTLALAGGDGADEDEGPRGPAAAAPSSQAIGQLFHPTGSRVLPAFEALPSQSELFARNQSKVDPLDPMSYYRQPPARVKPSYVTCFGPLAATEAAMRATTAIAPSNAHGAFSDDEDM